MSCAKLSGFKNDSMYSVVSSGSVVTKLSVGVIVSYSSSSLAAQHQLVLNGDAGADGNLDGCGDWS